MLVMYFTKKENGSRHEKPFWRGVVMENHICDAVISAFLNVKRQSPWISLVFKDATRQMSDIFSLFSSLTSVIQSFAH